MKEKLVLLTFILLPFVMLGQNERTINNLNNGMPNRISMNVTVAKQTQGATFGEKVSAGLYQSGSYIVFPNRQAFYISSDKVNEIEPAELAKVNQGINATGSALAQGASLVGGALPGGAILSAALSKSGSENRIWQIKNAGNEFKMPSGLSNGEYNLIVDFASGTKGSVIQAVFGLQVENGMYKVTTLKTRHDTVKNSISNVR